MLPVQRSLIRYPVKWTYDRDREQLCSVPDCPYFTSAQNMEHEAPHQIALCNPVGRHKCPPEFEGGHYGQWMQADYSEEWLREHRVGKYMATQNSLTRWLAKV
jgi:hypothetical protein